MSNEIVELGKRIADLREIFGYTTAQAADLTGLDEATYLQYENAQLDIPIGFLYEAAKVFHVELTALLTGGDPKLSRYALSRQNKGVELERNASYHIHSLAYNYSGKQIEPLHVRIQPDDIDEPIAMNAHPGQEWDYVLSGHMRLQIGQHILDLMPGDSIYFDPSVSHGMKAIGGELTFLAIILDN